MDSEEDNLIYEGLAEVYQPSSVFYNPVQEFNRDLTIAVLSEFAEDHFKSKRKKQEKLSATEGEKADKCDEKSSNVNLDPSVEKLDAGVPYSDGLKILEGLAASGLRSIRFAKEIPGVQSIVANDFDKKAVGYINRNIEYNRVSELVTPSCNDASMVMYQHKRPRDRFDVIDLDPYGSPCQFLDAGVQSVRDGGLLCVTCTDMAILCGSNAPETCYAKYGSMPVKGKFCHEMALRIILQSIESHANRYGRFIKPLISLSADFYVRVFLQVFSSQKIAKETVTKQSMMYHCGGCGAFVLQSIGCKKTLKNENFKYFPSTGPPVSERCEHCNSRHQLGGPIWSDPLYDTGFINRVLKRVETDPSRFTTSDRITGILTVMTEELQDIPLYYILDHLCSLLHLKTPKLPDFRSAILNAGYRVSLSHAAKNSIKTDAPLSVLWDILKCFEKTNPINKEHMKEGTFVYKILSKPCDLEANFDRHPDALPKSQGLKRWQINPERDWGPKPRAKEGLETLEERRSKGMLKAMEKRQSKRKVNEAQFKNHKCKRFKEGKCDLGDGCMYSHEEKTDENT